jgi:hypothetical protein
MFVGLKDWGKNSVVFGVDFEDGRGTRDFVLERKFDEGFSTENVFFAPLPRPTSGSSPCLC